jgi:hypothetical protein
MKQTSTLTRKLAAAQDTNARKPAQETCYRIYVGHETPVTRKGDISEIRERIAAITSRYVDGATLYATIGLWNGEREHSTVIESLSSARKHREAMTCLANELRYQLRQDTVILTAQAIDVVELS